jgi:hypothetical protein
MSIPAESLKVFGAFQEWLGVAAVVRCKSFCRPAVMASRDPLAGGWSRCPLDFAFPHSHFGNKKFPWESRVKETV